MQTAALLALPLLRALALALALGLGLGLPLLQLAAPPPLQLQPLQPLQLEPPPLQQQPSLAAAEQQELEGCWPACWQRSPLQSMPSP